MGHFEHTDKGDVFVTDINDYFESLDCLIRECKGYIDSELRYKEIIAEHDKQVLEEFSKWCEKNALNYEYIETTPNEIVNWFLTKELGE